MSIDDGAHVQSIRVFNNHFDTRIAVIDLLLHRSATTPFASLERSSHVFHEIVFRRADHQSKFVHEL